MTRLVVVGGGLSGLLAAAEARRQGVEVEVLEAAPTLGGVAQTIDQVGYRLEPAAGSLLLPNPHLSPILSAAGVETTPAPESVRRRWVATNQGLVELPSSPAALLRFPLLSPLAVAAALLEPLRGGHQPDSSLQGLLTDRLGEPAGRLAAHLAAAGVFAGDPSRLEAQAAFPQLAALLDRHRSLLLGALSRRRGGAPRAGTHSPAGGMAALAARLAAYVGAVRTSTPVEAVVPRPEGGFLVEGEERREAEAVLLAVPPEQAARILGGAVGELLGGWRYAPVAVVGIGFSPPPGGLPPGFGYLAAPDSGLVGIGGLFESVYDPSRAPGGRALVKLIAGGRLRPEVVDWDHRRLVQRVGGELARLLGHDLDAEWVKVVRHLPGIPQYERGHLARMRAIQRELAATPGLHLGGWWYRGIGVSQQAAEAVRVAAAVAGT